MSILIPLSDLLKLNSVIIDALSAASEAPAEAHEGKTLEEVTLEFLEASHNTTYKRYANGDEAAKEILAMLIASLTDDLSDILTL